MELENRERERDTHTQPVINHKTGVRKLGEGVAWRASSSIVAS
jgi:hypothetical protein